VLYAALCGIGSYSVVVDCKSSTRAAGCSTRRFSNEQSLRFGLLRSWQSGPLRVRACVSLRVKKQILGDLWGMGERQWVDAERVMVPLDPDCGDHTRTMTTNYLKTRRCIVQEIIEGLKRLSYTACLDPWSDSSDCSSGHHTWIIYGVLSIVSRRISSVPSAARVQRERKASVATRWV
jgi:hypothetical protein